MSGSTGPSGQIEVRIEDLRAAAEDLRRASRRADPRACPLSLPPSGDARIDLAATTLLRAISYSLAPCLVELRTVASQLDAAAEGYLKVDR